MVQGSGLIRECGNVTYAFSTLKDADAFAICVDGGGKPGHCAVLHNCIDKKFPERGDELSR